MFKPLVSIVVPVYNGADYLGEAIDSALAQTYDNIEIIVVNDGSTDNTDEIAKSYGDKIRYFAKENGGVASALNLALREMKGEYFSWLSHDDAYYPQKIEKQVKFMSELHDKNVALYSDYEFMDEKSRVKSQAVFDRKMLREKPEYALLRSAINGCTLLIPRKAFDEYGFFDEKLRCTQDYAKWFEMMKTYKFIHMPEILIKYRIHPMQDTNKNPNVVTEGDALWIDMIANISVEMKNKLEGNELNFYKEMSNYLENNTPYKEALKFSNTKVGEILAKKKKTSMLVSFISHSAEKSGAERALLDVIDAAREQGILAHMVLPGHGPMEAELSKRDIFYEIVELPWWANVNHANKQQILQAIRESALRLAMKLEIIKPDIVFTSTSVINEGAIAAKILGIPHIWSISEFGKEEHGVKYMLAEKERMAFVNEHSEKIFFVSKALKKYYDGQVDESKMVVMPNLVQIVEKAGNDKFFHKENALKMAILGNIISGKGQKDAILAVQELTRKNRQVELVVAGTSGNEDYYDALQKIIEDVKLQDSVRFVGFVDDATALISQADIVLVCATNEGFGRVTVEGMLLGKPVIGANSGATPELVTDGLNGFLYTPGDYEELARKIAYFIDHKEEIEQIGHKGYNFVRDNFNKEVYVKNLLKEFMELKNIKKEAVLPLEMIAEVVEDIKQANKEIKEKNLTINNIQQELTFIKTSKFWKMRGLYLKLQFAVFSPHKFLQKYFKKTSYLLKAAVASIRQEGLKTTLLRSWNFLAHGKGVLDPKKIGKEEEYANLGEVLENFKKN